MALVFHDYIFSIYYPRDAMLARVISRHRVSVPLSVRLFVCHKPAQYQNG